MMFRQILMTIQSVPWTHHMILNRFRWIYRPRWWLVNGALLQEPPMVLCCLQLSPQWRCIYTYIDYRHTHTHMLSWYSSLSLSCYSSWSYHHFWRSYRLGSQIGWRRWLGRLLCSSAGLEVPQTLCTLWRTGESSETIMGVYTPWCHQTWLAGKSHRNGGFNKNITEIHGSFSSTPCLITEGMNGNSRIRSYHIFGHILWEIPWNIGQQCMVGTSNLGSWNGHWL